MSSIILEVNLKNIKYNFNKLKKITNNKKSSAVVKSNAYGLGIKKIYKTLFKSGCRDFFVATLNESIKLRKFNSKINIYVLNGIKKNEMNLFVRKKIIPVINNINELNYILDSKKNINVCLHYDTGMNRLGMNYGEIERNIEKIRNSNIYIKYIISHLVSAELVHKKINTIQLNKFIKIKNLFKNTKLSLANSSGVFLSSKYHFDLIRPGISLYGGYGNKIIKKHIKNVVKLKSKIIQIKKINKNQTIGYNQKFRSKKDMKIATIEIGYGDGIPRLLSNKCYVYYRNKKLKILGNISMDTLVIDLTNIKNTIKIGDYIEIINQKNDIEIIAKIAKTVSQNILTSLSSKERIQIKYIE